jgi:hypothetical protein
MALGSHIVQAPFLLLERSFARTDLHGPCNCRVTRSTLSPFAPSNSQVPNFIPTATKMKMNTGATRGVASALVDTQANQNASD